MAVKKIQMVIVSTKDYESEDELISDLFNDPEKFQIDLVDEKKKG